MGCLTVFLYDKEHIPHIYPDATLQIWFEYDITAHCFPVAIKSRLVILLWH